MTRTERRTAARYRWDRVKVSFWFAPVIMAIAAVLLAWLMYWVESLVPNAALEGSRFVLAGTPGELRTALLSMAGTVLATAGVVFTLLTLPLSTVASHTAPVCSGSSWPIGPPSSSWVRLWVRSSIASLLLCPSLRPAQGRKRLN